MGQARTTLDFTPRDKLILRSFSALWPVRRLQLYYSYEGRPSRLQALAGLAGTLEHLEMAINTPRPTDDLKWMQGV